MIKEYRGSSLPGANLGIAFREVCRSILNPASLTFVAANAPSDVVNSFQVHQHKLASLSLRLATTTLIRQLRRKKERTLEGPLSWVFECVSSTVRNSFLLAACTCGRFSISVLQVLRLGIPRRMQLSLSANILTNLGNLLKDAEVASEPLAEDQLDGQVGYTAVANPSNNLGPSNVTEDILRALNMSLPNDLSRLIFLATLRDNNSGHYFHPELARRFSPEVADWAMLACHRRIYQQVVALALEDLTDQLDAYMATVMAPRKRLIESWTRLRDYRATIPIDADVISAEIFFMKVDVAVAILGARLPGKVHW